MREPMCRVKGIAFWAENKCKGPVAGMFEEQNLAGSLL